MRLSPEDRKLYYEQWVLPQKAKKIAIISGLLQEVLGKIFQHKIIRRIFLCIAGAIGVGKSTITKEASPLVTADPYYEELPKFIGDFYKAMEEFEQAVVNMLKNPTKSNKARFYRIRKKTQELSFRLQIWFLHKRFSCHLTIMRQKRDAIQDRSIYEDLLFALLLYLEDKMSYSQLESYLLGFVTHTKILRPPTAILYLWADLDTLMYRILKRARDIESALSPYYEQELVDLYELFYKFYPCPIIKVNVSGLVDLTCLMENSWAKFMEKVWPGVLDMKSARIKKRRFHRLEIDFTEEIARQPLVSRNGNGHKQPGQHIILSNHDLGYSELTMPICQQTI